MVGMRFDYKLPVGAPDVTFEVLSVQWVANPDPNQPLNASATVFEPEYTVVQRYPISGVPDQWNRLEAFCMERDDIAFRFTAADEVVLDLDNVEFIIREKHIVGDEYVTDSDCEDPATTAWTPIAGGVLSKVDYSGNLALRVEAAAIGDGFEQEITVRENIVHDILRLQLLNVIGQWRIMLDNDALASTWTETLDISEDWTSVAMASSPQPNGTTHKLRVEALTAGATLDLDEISLRKFTGPVWGSAVPIP